MLDTIFKLKYVKEIVSEKNIDIKSLNNFLIQNKEYIPDLGLENIYSKINITQTHFGSCQLKNKLLNPFNKNLVDKQINILIIQKQSEKVINLLNDIQGIQNTLCNLAIEPIKQTSLIKNVYFSDYFEPLNKYEVALQGHIMVNIYSPIYNTLSPIIILVIPAVLSKIMPENYVNIFMSTFFIGIPNFKTLNYKSTGQILYTIATLLFFAYSIYSSIKISLKTKKVIKLLKKKNKAYNKLIDIVTELNEIIPCNFDIPNKNSLECSRGKIVLNYLSITNKDKLKEIFEYIGDIDVWTSCTRLLNLGYSLVYNIPESIQPIISVKNMSNPLFDKVKNNLILKGQNMILSGPNAAGKTTLMKTLLINVVLAQSLGISKCDKMVITEFDNILTNIRKTDEKLSLFQTEMKQIGEIIGKADQEKCLIAIDEICSSTNNKDANEIAVKIANKLSKTNSISIITTHLDSLKNLKNTNFLNYHMKINRNNGKVQYTYKLCKGISNESTALDNINSLSIDIKKSN